MGRWDPVQQETTGQAEASFLELATLSSGFQVLLRRSRQEDEGKLSCSRPPLEEEGVGPWQEKEARPSHEADSPTPTLVMLAAPFVQLRMSEEARLKRCRGRERSIVQISVSVDLKHEKADARSFSPC